MSEDIQAEQEMAPVSGLGLALRQGRETKGYTVERVADELHLRPSIVVAIEEESYQLLPGDIFLKGYIRSYTRLVGLNEAEMMELLDQQLNYEADISASEKQAKGKEKRKRRSKYVLLLLLVAIIFGAGLYLWGDKLGETMTHLFLRESNSQSMSSDGSGEGAKSLNSPVTGNSDVSSKGNESENSFDPDDLPDTPSVDSSSVDSSSVVNSIDESVTSNKESGAINTTTDELSPLTSDIVVLPSEEQVKKSAEKDVNTAIGNAILIPSDSPKRVDENATPGLTTPDTEKAVAVDGAIAEDIIVENIAPVTPLEHGAIKVIFSGECWFTLKNGEGRTVFAALKQAGDEINYSGALPFSVVVGAVSEVNVFFDEKLVDFSTVRVRNNRASLELTH